MRKRTLYGICFAISLAIAYGLSALARAQGIAVPFSGIAAHLLASLAILPLLILPLSAINRRLLSWRKERGRDIEEEEKHEFDDADIISLRPRQSHETSSTYRRWED